MSQVTHKHQLGYPPIGKGEEHQQWAITDHQHRPWTWLHKTHRRKFIFWHHFARGGTSWLAQRNTKTRRKKRQLVGGRR